MTIRCGLLVICFGFFAANLAAQADVSQSEIEGFRFSADDRAKRLTLLESRIEDVIAVFGKDCVHGCQFNDDWDISFAYVNSGWSTTRMKNGVKVVYKPKRAVVDKLADINFKPRRPITMPSSAKFPANLKCSKGETTRGTLRYRSQVCSDFHTLTYFIYDEDDPNGKYKKNEIQQITYSTIPTDRIFTK